jgi:hypothetical protein
MRQKRTIPIVILFGTLMLLVGLACADRESPRLNLRDLATPTIPPTQGTPTPTSVVKGDQDSLDIFGFEYIDTVRVAEWDDNTVKLVNFIVGYALVQGYVYGVEIVEFPDGDYHAALASGEVDIVLAMSRTESKEWYDEVTESGEVIDLGSLFGEDSDLRIGVNTGLNERVPEVVDLLRTMTPGEEVVTDLVSRLTGGRVGIKPNVAGIMYFQRNEDAWTQWMTGEAVAGIKTAIEERKTGLHRKCLSGDGSSVYCK